MTCCPTSHIHTSTEPNSSSATTRGAIDAEVAARMWLMAIASVLRVPVTWSNREADPWAHTWESLIDDRVRSDLIGALSRVVAQMT